MTDGTEPQSRGQASRPPPPRLPWVTAPIKVAALVLGGCITMLVLTSLVGLFVDAVWLQCLIAAVPAVGIPLVMVDRLLPKDGGSRPGLGTDVAAMVWMVTATAAVALGSSALSEPLQQQAERLDDKGMHRMAWSVRWLGAAEAPTQAQPEPEVAAVATKSDD
ncbi:MAG: hypothetical protein AAF721_41425, partial [Myxococcota bacterium]